MPKWLIYFIVLVVGAGIGFGYTSIQSGQLVNRITETEAQLLQASKNTEEAKAEIVALRAELAEKGKMLGEQTERIKALEDEIAKSKSGQ